MGSEATSLNRIVVTTLFWATVPTTELEPSGASGDSTSASNSSAAADWSSVATRSGHDRIDGVRRAEAIVFVLAQHRSRVGRIGLAVGDCQEQGPQVGGSQRRREGLERGARRIVGQEAVEG